MVVEIGMGWWEESDVSMKDEVYTQLVAVKLLLEADAIIWGLDNNRARG